MSSSDIDSILHNMLASIERKKLQLNEAAKELSIPWKTNCAFSVTPSQPAYNIQVANLSELQLIVAQLLELKRNLPEAQEFLGLAVDTKLDLRGYPIADWLSDCKKRANTITYKEKQKKLVELERTAASLMSEESKRTAALAQLIENAKGILGDEDSLT